MAAALKERENVCDKWIPKRAPLVTLTLCSFVILHLGPSCQCFYEPLPQRKSTIYPPLSHHLCAVAPSDWPRGVTQTSPIPSLLFWLWIKQCAGCWWCPEWTLMIWLQRQTSNEIIRKAAEKGWKRVGGEEADGETMRRTKGNMQHHILAQPTAESARLQGWG